ncbi:methyl-accepting chemotaxis protein [Agrobacterium vitis]|nr:methyl-accepting chemotaxis protein [Agrobacterium vitis]MBE1440300.1 methyl-accepting chemotaxis protein [Agrobacterium vitis]
MGSFSLSFGRDARSILSSLSKSLAIIEFDLNGNILDANDNFCKALGYAKSEIVGKHHRIFVDPQDASSQAYRDFWAKLASGQFDQGQYKRLGKNGQSIWIEASYNPVFRGKKPYKVVKIATDITAIKLKNMDNDGKLAALSRSQAVIEFTPDGTILTANENFCQALGYELNEIVGKHHAMFCDPAYATSADYKDFWRSLDKGEYKSNEFLRIGKGGIKVYIQATYNPIFDEKGTVVKVVKFATNVTGRVTAVDSIARGLERLADCNMGTMLDEPLIPEFEHLRAAFNTSITKVREMLSEVLALTTAVSTNGQTMRTDSSSLAQRSEQQTTLLTQTSTALEQITVTMTEAASRTGSTRTLVRDARQAATESTKVVGFTVEAMSRIEGASKEISNIISVIDEIAFQTNLLALNAGVEAARAGESGKGFAVVAQEVRELAQRSAKAAREISTLITKSGEEVTEGVRLVGETGNALNRISTFVESIDTNIEAITMAANEQSTRLGDISSAVGKLDQVTQENASMVNGINAISEALFEGAAKLADLANRFQLGNRTTIMHRTASSDQRRSAA